MGRSLMIGGTASHVGKSWMATAICRWLRNRGIRVAPFKAQNMSNNSYPCSCGGEIGRAQVEQAYACGIEPTPDMNPILLKPTSDRRSQIVLEGKVWKNLDACSYYERFDFLLSRVLAAYQRLSQQYEFIVIEGAGSITELNLKSRDLVNLGLAQRIGAPLLLLADIDRGGVFASIVGSFALLETAEAALVRGFAVNRFRGDPRLFRDGVQILEQRTNRPCLGVFPFAPDIELDQEDAVSLDEIRSSNRGSDVVIVHLPHISNTTDFRLLPNAVWLKQPIHQQFSTIILPGTKNTIDDLLWLQKTGLFDWIRQQHRHGATVIGICGGYQMLGESIEDPEQVESEIGQVDGLGLIALRTVMSGEKLVRRVNAVTPTGIEFQGYEIHVGKSFPTSSTPFATLDDGTPDGIRANRCFGTYLHGALEHPAVLGELLCMSITDAKPRELMYDQLATWFDSHVNRQVFEEQYLCA